MARKMIVTPNQIARRAGYNRATEVVVGDQNRVVSYTPFGYRKYTTGEYVYNAYRNKFGWKNTYYQHAEVEVEVNINDCY
jgi:hypothetical protein